MKNILLSADSEISVFAVPDKVADNLEQYCLEFCDWLLKSPDAARYRTMTANMVGLCYNEKDFIAYLNQYISTEQAALMTTLAGVYVGDELPDKYAGLPYFNF